MAEDTIYLTTGEQDGEILAIISKGSPQLGDENVVILDINRLPSKEEAEAWFEQMMIARPWEEKKDFDVILSPEVQAQADADPALAEMLRDMSANLRQAMEGVESGRYKSFNDAMEAITGERPEKVEIDE